jgi:invasion plasmid antigen
MFSIGNASPPPAPARLQKMNLAEQNKADIFAELAEWEKGAIPGEGEDRTEAVLRIKKCYEGDKPDELDLSGLNLRSLPDTLPPLLRWLDLSDNELTELPYLPEFLTELYANRNQLKHLPPLPANLEKLIVADNNLRSLPDTLPSTLITLDVSYNELTQLPYLPALLTYLYADHNQLGHLPLLSTYLNVLMVGINNLADLPEHWPDFLETIDIGDNPFTRIPETLMALSGLCSIYFENPSLSAENMQQLRDKISSPAYSGPRFIFSMIEINSFPISPVDKPLFSKNAWGQQTDERPM